MASVAAQSLNRTKQEAQGVLFRPSLQSETRGLRLLLEVAARADLTLGKASTFDLLHRGDDHFQRLLTAVRGARHSVWIEMYQVAQDPVGWKTLAELGAASRRGVEVRLLVDPFGSARLRKLLPAIRRQGVEVRWYNPWRPWSSPWKRTHRKLIVIDRKLASVGGINLNSDFSESLAGAAAWRDVAVWIQGTVVDQLAEQFAAAWQGGDVGRTRSRAILAGPGELCAVGGGADGRHGHAEAWRALVDAARSEFLLATPYFLPDAELRNLLVRAAARGVDVAVVLPRHSDMQVFKHAARHLYKPLLRAGVSIRERCDRMVHAKVALVDRQLAAMGSANFNRQSLYANSETLVLATAKQVVRELRSLIVEEARRSTEMLCPRRWESHPERSQWAERLASVFGLVF
jgi:cardiolipin synthase